MGSRLILVSIGFAAVLGLLTMPPANGSAELLVLAVSLFVLSLAVRRPAYPPKED
jgi:hypothetical protein